MAAQPPKDALARQLWDLWKQGEQPDVGAFLAKAGPLPAARLVAVLRVDQHQRWRWGQIVAAETYLQHFPSLKDSPEALALIFDEILLRQERGEAVPIDEYYRRFPEFAARIWERASKQEAAASDESLRHLASRADRPKTAAKSADGKTDPASSAEVHQRIRDAQEASFLKSGLETPQTAMTLEKAPDDRTEIRQPSAKRSPSTVPDARPPGMFGAPRIPGYEILRELGRGGMGVVYLARQTQLKRLVALKMVRAVEMAEGHELARFRAEAEAAAQLQHPNIVQIYEVGEYDGRPYFSLEYVDGDDLAWRLRDNLPKPEKAAELLLTVTEAIQAAHQKKIIHRDLKPANILLTRDGVPKVADFGLAKHLHDESARTTSGTVIGSPSYMPPEQAKGEIERISIRSDIYSLGAILYECLTGRPPFRAATAVETMTQVATVEPVPPRQLQPDLPRDLETICLKCLQKDPQKRYASAKSLAADLKRFLDGDAILARPVGVFERGWRWCRRNKAVAGMGAILAIILLGGFITVSALYLRAEGLRRQAEENEAKARAEERKAAANLAESNKLMGVYLQNNGEFVKAETLFRQALTIRAKLATEQPEDPEQRGEQVVLLNNLANLLDNTQRPAEAEQTYRQALALAEPLLEQFPKEERTRRVLAVCLNNWANFLTEVGRYQEAEQAFQRTLSLQERLTADFPNIGEYQAELGNSYANLGLTLASAGRAQEAMPWFEKGISLMQRLIDQNNRFADAQRLLSLAYSNRARALVKLNRPSESIKDWDQAILLNDGAKRPQFQAERAQACAKSGDMTKAADEIEALAKRRNLPLAALYEMAHAAALYAPSLGDAHAKQAVDWLTDIANYGYFRNPGTVELLKKDPDFDSLRKREDFRALMKNLSKGYSGFSQ